MNKILCLAVLLFSLPSFAESCRTITRKNSGGKLTASFLMRCEDDEHLGPISGCTDRSGYLFDTDLRGLWARCINIEYYNHPTEIGFCDEEIEDDTSCLNPIIFKYNCCK